MTDDVDRDVRRGVALDPYSPRRPEHLWRPVAKVESDTVTTLLGSPRTGPRPAPRDDYVGALLRWGDGSGSITVPPR